MICFIVIRPTLDDMDPQGLWKGWKNLCFITKKLKIYIKTSVEPSPSQLCLCILNWSAHNAVPVMMSLRVHVRKDKYSAGKNSNNFNRDSIVTIHSLSILNPFLHYYQPPAT